MYIADEENASDSFALHNYLGEHDKRYINDTSLAHWKIWISKCP